jgi:hypothetical protein
MIMEEWAEEACDQIDAGFFSGDAFHDEAALTRIEEFIARWQGEIANIREFMAENQEEK